MDSLNEFDNKNIFKFDYDGQYLDNNSKYKKWKKLMILNYGKDVKFSKCLKDKIIFINAFIKNRKINDSIYSESCPICKNFICYFCSYSNKERCWIKCCFRNAFYTKLIYMPSKYVEKDDKLHYQSFFLLIPGITIIAFFFNLCVLFLCFTATEKSKHNGKGELKESNFINNKINLLLTFIIGFLISIIFLVYNAYITIFLIIFSIPNKFFPIKYIYGIWISI